MLYTLIPLPEDITRKYNQEKVNGHHQNWRMDKSIDIVLVPGKT
jgi:hypothetical protein